VAKQSGRRDGAKDSAGAVARRRSAADQALEELFKGKLPSQWRADYKDAFDWGPDVGRERVEDERG